MVHIKRVELSHFKSFGGTTRIPFLPGFTVVSGPNGSGKSNILDALLFCLGLASSKGMRAERLPDLINHKQSTNGRAAETSVSVTFDISDLDGTLETWAENTELKSNDCQSNEWTVTRRLRVTKAGAYSSTFYVNGEVRTVTEVHEQLNRLRIYPEGYNIVLQGDVTRIISMNSRERREIIDELAGVAEFDRKIEQTKKTLESVREREDRCGIVEQELVKNLDRLAEDRIKAEKYQLLKAKIQQKQTWETILIAKSLQQQRCLMQIEIANREHEIALLSERLGTVTGKIGEASARVERLNSRVKALGEEERLGAASELATQKAKYHQFLSKQRETIDTLARIDTSIQSLGNEIELERQNSSSIAKEKFRFQIETIPTLLEAHNAARETLTRTKEEANAIATAAEAWVQEQTTLARQVAEVQNLLNPQRTERAQLVERQNQLQKKTEEQTQQINAIEAEIDSKQADIARLSARIDEFDQKILSLSQQLTITEQERTIEQDTHKRLLKEQRDKQRELDKLEATKQARQEAAGTYATKVILNANIKGVYGLVAQLGQVEPRFQLALETAAGGRLGHIVVENDEVAAIGIELLKQKKAGRATFLPLNKINSSHHTDTLPLRYSRGFIDSAVNLISCEPRYRQIFIYVFGATVVFETLNDARPYLGKQRIVTLEGDILETSGAMTGGSKAPTSNFRFDTILASESEESELLEKRLEQIDRLLNCNERSIVEKSALAESLSREVTDTKQQGREQQLRLEQLRQEIQQSSDRKEQLISQIDNNQRNLDIVLDRLQFLESEIPLLEARLQDYQQQLAKLEESHSHREWQQIQTAIAIQEAEVREKENNLRTAQNQLKDLEVRERHLLEKISSSERRLEEYRQQQVELKEGQIELKESISALEKEIAQAEDNLEQLFEKLEETKKERDRAEEELREVQNQQQQESWQLQKIREVQQEKLASLHNLERQIVEHQKEFPDSLADSDLPSAGDDEEETETIAANNLAEQLEQIQKQIRSAQKRLQAMEPVNMLALEEHEHTRARLQELSDKLTTLEAERTELLLRIEKFTTLRLKAFKEAFDAVNENFQSIFATLSDGDGYLELEDPKDPFNGGLNLIAHPKGKPVQRLSSMSGGEKSLTALSFIFSLQRYRPSPFYAFDEVDMFLDGANVERLSGMIEKQAKQAQFIVVSLRRPMIEASERTIGVTQARGAHTQVLGIKL